MLSVAGALALEYVAYLVLTATVLLVFTSLVFSYAAIFGSEMPFLRYVAFALPYDSTGTAHLDGADIMRLFSRMAFLLMVVSLALKGLWRLAIASRRPSVARVRDTDEQGERRPWQRLAHVPGVRRLLTVTAVITAVYLITFAVIPFADWADDSSSAGGYAVFGIFYVMAIVSGGFYVTLDTVSDRLLSWAGRKLG